MLKLPEKMDSATDTKILLDAISKDKIHLARFILDALDGKIVDSKAEGAHTPLISSVFLPDMHARCKFMNLLLQRGANVNQQDESGRTALSYACEKGYLDAVKMLVRNNADPEMIDNWGNTALMYAAVAGHSLVVEFLVKAFKRLGLQIDRPNKVGNSAVEVAKYLGHKECLSALMCSSKKAYAYEKTICKGSDHTSAEDEREELLSEFSERKDVGQLTLHGKILAADEMKLQIRSGPKRLFILQGKMNSMDSIEELERESDSLPPSPQGFLLSNVLTPKPPQRSRVFLTQNHTKGGDICTTEQLPPVSRGVKPLYSVLCSPRVTKDMSRILISHTPPACPLSGSLGILMTPIAKTNEEVCHGKKTCDSSMRQFDDSYYRKRCSLPTSALGLAGQELGALKPLYKCRTSLKPLETELKDIPMAPKARPPAFSVLGSKLLRRFTFPELKKSSKEGLRVGSGAQDHLEHRECGMDAQDGMGMPRSQTFPLWQKHPQVGSKPSVDSISAVKCEFDFQPKVAAAALSQ